ILSRKAAVKSADDTDSRRLMGCCRWVGYSHTHRLARFHFAIIVFPIIEDIASVVGRVAPAMAGMTRPTTIRTLYELWKAQ
ncbi:MAG TPA: hypothetical protein VFY78_09235, partial [Gammaproteobacteria bacterium]|nr:hypothetical protein [Gammaproteobacteria bacterium]